MIDIRNELKGVTDREKWAARGATFVAKAKATKVVWFPPEPVETGKKAGKKAASTAKTATKKTTGAAKRTTSSTARKPAGAAKKATSSARKAAKRS